MGLEREMSVVYYTGWWAVSNRHITVDLPILGFGVNLNNGAYLKLVCIKKHLASLFPKFCYYLILFNSVMPQHKIQAKDLAAS